MKKLISLLLVIAVMATSVVAFAAEAIPEYDHNCLTDCKGDCEYSPLIVVPGIMQSQVYVQDGNGNDLLTSDGFPIVEGMDMQFMFDMNAIYDEIPMLVIKLLLSFLMGDIDIFTNGFVDVFDSAFSSHYFNPDGTRTNGVQVDEYWYSAEVAMTKPDKSYGYAQGYRTDEEGNTLPSYKYEYEYDFINAQVDITEYCDMAGYDHLYYYSYSSFGDTLAIAEKLDAYIQMVKEQTGHDKVSLVFISLGGTIGNTYLAKHCDPDDIDRIVFAAGANDGSYLLSDLMDSAICFDDSEHFYSEMLPMILKLTDSGMDWLGYLLNFVIRALPQSLFTNQIDYMFSRVVNDVLGNLLHNCPSMWALVPSAEYERMADKYISDEAHAQLRAKTDEYYEIQKNAAKTLQKLTDEGMEIFVISGYNLPLVSLVEHWYYTSDEIIHVQSTSFGATAAPYGETLAEDYVPAIDESYISPEREIDAGTAALPDRTWFVRGQSHLKLQASVEDVIALCVAIVTDKSITDARENNGGYPQFNSYRDIKGLRDRINTYENLTEEDFKDFTNGEKAYIENAYKVAVRVRDSRVWDYDEAKAAEVALYTALYDHGLIDGDSPFMKYELNNMITPVAKFASDLMLKYFGAKDYYTF